MAIIVLSVAHTGTRYLCSFLDSIGVIYRQYHSEPANLEMLSWETHNKAIIPVRDPLLCLTSTLARGDLNNFESILANVVMHFELLRELEKEFEFEYFKLGEENFESIRDFASAKLPLPDKKLDPIGAIASKPSNYKTWEIFAKRLGEEKRDKALSELKEIREYYGY